MFCHHYMMLKAKKYMTYSEVTSIIGLPQRYLTFGLTVVEYDLSNGQHLTVEYCRRNDGRYIVMSNEIKE